MQGDLGHFAKVANRGMWCGRGEEGGGRVYRNVGGKNFYSHSKWKANTSVHGVAHTRSSTDRGGSAFLVDMFYVLVGGAVGSLRTKVPSSVGRPHAPKIYFYGFDDDKSLCSGDKLGLT